MNQADIKRMKEEYEKSCLNTARIAQKAMQTVLMREARNQTQH